MIRIVILLALWAALPAAGQVGSAALFTQFESRPAAAVVEALQDEVGALMAPNGLRFEWKSLPTNDQSVWTELAVVKFSGRCEVLPFATNSHSDLRLGWTHVSDGVVIPFAEVDCDAIRAFILKGLLGMGPPSRDQAYGRAIGRVAAHELLHIFAKTTAHSSHGVDHPTLSEADLLADHLSFEELEPSVHMLHASLAPPSQAGRGSAQAGRSSYVQDGCSGCHGAQGEGTLRGPVLRGAGILNSVTLAAKLTKSQDKMYERARTLKVATPSMNEDEISGLVTFLKELDQ